MPAQLNHTIVHARDKRTLGPVPRGVARPGSAHEFGPFLVVRVANDVSLDFVDDRNDRPTALRLPRQRGGVRPDLRPDQGAGPDVLGGPATAAGSDQHPLRRTRRVLVETRTGTTSRSSRDPTADNTARMRVHGARSDRRQHLTIRPWVSTTYTNCAASYLRPGLPASRASHPLRGPPPGAAAARRLSTRPARRRSTVSDSIRRRCVRRSRSRCCRRRSQR